LRPHIRDAEAVGKNVTHLQPGDEVFGSCAGALAEYASAKEEALDLKPDNLTMEQAAAIGVSAMVTRELLDHMESCPE
jgi:NADPH:quinone reductase-like Zn-dependent oxidoreductase